MRWLGAQALLLHVQAGWAGRQHRQAGGQLTGKGKQSVTSSVWPTSRPSSCPLTGLSLFLQCCMICVAGEGAYACAGACACAERCMHGRGLLLCGASRLPDACLRACLHASMQPTST